MKRWWLVIALLLSVGVNLGILSTIAVARWRAQPAEIPSEGALARRLPEVIRRMADDLHLEGERRQEFFELQRTFFETTLRARGKVFRLQGELRRELLSAEPDRAKLDALLAELGPAHAALEGALIDNVLGAHELLDPEQHQRYLRLLGRWRRERESFERRARESFERRARERFDRREPGQKNPPE